MPFFWTGGFNGGLLSAIVAGATLLTEAIPEPAATLALLERERATLFRGWPDQAAKLATDPAFASTDLTSLGPGSLGPVLPPALRPTVGARANLFGMTETAGPYCGDRLDTDLPADKFGSCGRPFTGIDVRIGEAGEIQLRGPRVMRTIVGRLRESIFDADRYYRTGDVGSLDADGYLWYDGRLDDMVKISGATVFPGEVESALRTIDGVRQAHVTDVTIEGSTQIAALVITDLVIDEVASAAAAKLSSFKVPTLWLTAASTDLVPLSASSKIDKAALQQLITRDGSRAMKKK
jgi:acyl-coenzyme A synthetase/AMP-(fatty) acid ligase